MYLVFINERRDTGARPNGGKKAGKKTGEKNEKGKILRFLDAKNMFFPNDMKQKLLKQNWKLLISNAKTRGAT